MNKKDWELIQVKWEQAFKLLVNYCSTVLGVNLTDEEIIEQIPTLGSIYNYRWLFTFFDYYHIGISFDVRSRHASLRRKFLIFRGKVQNLAGKTAHTRYFLSREEAEREVYLLAFPLLEERIREVKVPNSPSTY